MLQFLTVQLPANLQVYNLALLKDQMQEKPKSIRTIRRLRKLEPKLVEGAKSTLFVRGNKSSSEVMAVMKDLRALRKNHSVMFSRKHEIHPFEDRTQLEKVCKKANASLFVFGSHSKKRPSNIVIGRTYEHKVLDMVELGIIGTESISDIMANAAVPLDAQPFLVFQGDLWESDGQLKKLRNLINDFFLMNNRPASVEIDKVMKVVVSWSVTEDRHIHLRTFEVTVEGGAAVLSQEGKLVVEELGPHAQFVLRRESFAEEELFKKATHVAKPKKKKQNKNVEYDNLGNKRGKLYVDRQNLKALPFRKRKMISKGETREGGEIIGHTKNEDEFAR